MSEKDAKMFVSVKKLFERNMLADEKIVPLNETVKEGRMKEVYADLCEYHKAGLDVDEAAQKVAKKEEMDIMDAMKLVLGYDPYKKQNESKVNEIKVGQEVSVQGTEHYDGLIGTVEWVGGEEGAKQAKVVFKDGKSNLFDIEQLAEAKDKPINTVEQAIAYLKNRKVEIEKLGKDKYEVRDVEDDPDYYDIISGKQLIAWANDESKEMNDSKKKKIYCEECGGMVDTYTIEMPNGKTMEVCKPCEDKVMEAKKKSKVNMRSILEPIVANVKDMSKQPLEGIKSYIEGEIIQHDIDRLERQKMVNTVNSQRNFASLITYLYNALLKYEGLGTSLGRESKVNEDAKNDPNKPRLKEYNDLEEQLFGKIFNLVEDLSFSNRSIVIKVLYDVIDEVKSLPGQRNKNEAKINEQDEKDRYKLKKGDIVISLDDSPKGSIKKGDKGKVIGFVSSRYSDRDYQLVNIAWEDGEEVLMQYGTVGLEKYGYPDTPIKPNKSFQATIPSKTDKKEKKANFEDLVAARNFLVKNYPNKLLDYNKIEEILKDNGLGNFRAYSNTFINLGVIERVEAKGGPLWRVDSPKKNEAKINEQDGEKPEVPVDNPTPEDEGGEAPEPPVDEEEEDKVPAVKRVPASGEEKEYLGSKGSEQYFYVKTVYNDSDQPEDLLLVDASGDQILTAKEAELDPTDMVNFILEAIKVAEITMVSTDIVEKYIVVPEEEEEEEEEVEQELEAQQPEVSPPAVESPEKPMNQPDEFKG